MTKYNIGISYLTHLTDTSTYAAIREADPYLQLTLLHSPGAQHSTRYLHMVLGRHLPGGLIITKFAHHEQTLNC